MPDWLTLVLQGFTLEEMDDIFDAGVPAWRTAVKKSRLEVLEEKIATGDVKIEGPSGTNPGLIQTTDEKAGITETTGATGTHEDNARNV